MADLTSDLESKIRERISALEWDDSVSDRIMKIQVLEAVLRELQSGRYTEADAREALDAAADIHFGDKPKETNGASDGNCLGAEADDLGGVVLPFDAYSLLVKRTERDAGAPFQPETLERLAGLKREDRSRFESLRRELKKAGCRVGELDKALRKASGENEGKDDRKQADVLIDLATQEAALFHAPDTTPFADLQVNGHRETWPVRSRGFKRWLARRYFETQNGAPNSEAMTAALNVLEAKAHFDGPELEVHVRIGAHEGCIYLDLGDETWCAVEVDADGWRVIEEPPVRFRRASGMQALPAPTRGGSIETLRDFLNVQSDAEFVLAVSWVLAALRDCGPYPVLVLSGEQGAAKSTFSAIVRALVDPNTAPLRALPREDRDLFIAANNGRVLAFDNCSGLQSWISDTLCRLATGGGFSVRQLYTDQDEMLFDATRPIILNGITDIVTRPDLADRAIFLSLEPIPEEKRKPEKDLWRDFNTVRPMLLGVLLDAVSTGLDQLPHVKLATLPRMADFALWATACESTFWEEGTFAAAYDTNREEAVDSVIEGDLVASAISALMAEKKSWEGTASELLSELEKGQTDERSIKSKHWPSSARSLSGRIRRAATFLRKKGINISFTRDPGGEGGKRTRMITISKEGGADGPLPF